MAAELHDTVAHTLTLITLHMQIARKKLPDCTANKETRQELDLMEATLSNGWTDLRDLLRAMSGDYLDDAVHLNRIQQVKELVAAVDQIGFPVHLVIDGAPQELPSLVGRVMYRIVQESLTNALKYAPQGSARVAMTFSDDEMRLEVTDSGVGRAGRLRFKGAGLGLRGMRARVALLGGEVHTGHRPDGGYRVLAKLPLAVR